MPQLRKTLVALSTVALVHLSASACTPRPEPSPSKKSPVAVHRAPPGGSPIPPPPKPTSGASRSTLALPSAPPMAPPWGVGADASGNNGVVTSVEDSATRAGTEILEQGGNAVDAAVATALALAVTHPSAGNLGGGGFLLLKLGNTVEAIDFRENSPAALNEKRFGAMIKGGGHGPASVGVPGTVAGLHLAHSRHGKLRWSEVVTPALRLATEGYALGKRQALTIQWAEKELRADPVANKAFFPGGHLPASGTVIKRPRLAKALTRIRDEGPSGFYEGPTAQDLVASLNGGGWMTLDDLKAYKAIVREPLYFDFEGYRVITMPAPSAGGVALAQTLLMLRDSKIAATKADSTARYHLVAEASRRAQVERQLFVVSPDELTKAEQTTQRKRALDPQTWLATHPIAAEKATPSGALHPHFRAALRELEQTTHLSVIDGDGGLVSLTVTLSGSFGARLFTKETGIALNNSSASFSSVGINTPRPGTRTTSSMAPTLVIASDGRALVLGSPGGDTIPSTITQTFLRLVLDGASLKNAVDAARFHQSFAPDTLSMEKDTPLPAQVQKELRALGHHLTTRRSALGDANIAAFTGGTAYAVFDRREGGLALAPQSSTAAEEE